MTENTGRIGLLKGAWEQAQQDNQKAYSSALKKAIIVKAGKVYDPLWQEGDDRERNELDQLIQSCSETEYGEGLIEKCKNTTAGKAREFMNELGKLSKSGMDLAPVKAGKLIREMREEKVFNQCFRSVYKELHADRETGC